MSNVTKNILFKSLRFLDIFGVSVNFRIHNDWEHKSNFSGTLSLLFIIISFAYVIQNFVTFVKKENMSLIFTNKIIDSNPAVNLILLLDLLI
jgi:hypothetical protein